MGLLFIVFKECFVRCVQQNQALKMLSPKLKYVKCKASWKNN